MIYQPNSSFPNVICQLPPPPLYTNDSSFPSETTGTRRANASVLCNLVFLVFVTTVLAVFGVYFYRFDFPIIFILVVMLQISFLLFVLLTNSLLFTRRPP